MLGLLARFRRDTSCAATIDYGLIAAGVAVAIFLALEEIGSDRRVAARALFNSLRFEIGNQ